ncbi:MAG: 5-dehydro-4-deoxy-D-glucuronate isomerase [Tepidisphaeraceae bacterium]
MSCPRAHEAQTMSGDALRRAFLVPQVMGDNKISMTFTDLDRMAVGGVRPTGGPVILENDRETGAEFFLARREMGVLNVGGPGKVNVDGRSFDLANLDCLYVGMGSKSVSFESTDKATPAKFFLLSCPAHATHPTTHVSREKSNAIALGAPATANQRKIYQYIHPGGIKSCQLVMGFTEMAEGSVWNTMPPHTHSRRTEIYFYFDIPKDNVVAHFMGPPDNTRHLFVQSEQAVLSPSWSIHSGCGTAAYKFIWAMAGENQTFDDMDKVAPVELR